MGYAIGKAGYRAVPAWKEESVESQKGFPCFCDSTSVTLYRDLKMLLRW